MKFRLIRLQLLFALIIPLAAMAQQPGNALSLSLKEAQEYALKNNRNITNARIDTELAKKKIWETTAIGLPQVSAAANYQHIFKVPEVSFGGTVLSKFRNGNTLYGLSLAGDSLFVNSFDSPPIKLGVADNLTFDVNVTQLLFSGAYLVGLQASRVFSQMSDQALVKTEIDTRENVANTYFLVLNLQQNAQVLRQRKENLEKTLSELKEMYKVGFIENTDVDQVELTVLVLSNALGTLDRQVTAATDLLKFQLGLPFENDLLLTDKLDRVMESVSLQAIADRQLELENNILYKMMSTQVTLGELNLKREQSNYLPSVAAFYRHSEKARKADFDFTMKDIAGVQLNIPIFSSGQRNAMVAQRRLELDKIKNSKQLAMDGLKLEFMNARNEFTSSFEKYQNEKRNIELAGRIYDKTMLKYKEGLSSSMDITNAQNQYLSAQQNYFTAIYSLLVAKNKLDKLTNNQ